MSKIYTSADQLIGHTPLLELTHIEKEEKLEAKILAKLEYFNPAGSVKDRIAKGIIDDAEQSGKLQPGGTIIEPTSGNTGIGLAAVAAARGYKLIIVMPDTMSVERRQLIKAYGAELVLSEGAKGMKGAIEKANELSAQIPGSIIAGQFTNPANPKTHFATTGPPVPSPEKSTAGLLRFPERRYAVPQRPPEAARWYHSPRSLVTTFPMFHRCMTIRSADCFSSSVSYST